MYYLRVFLALSTMAIVLSTCAISPEIPLTLEQKLEARNYTVGEEVKRIRNYRINGWNYLDSTHGIVRFRATTLPDCNRRMASRALMAGANAYSPAANGRSPPNPRTPSEKTVASSTTPSASSSVPIDRTEAPRGITSTAASVKGPGATNARWNSQTPAMASVVVATAPTSKAVNSSRAVLRRGLPVGVCSEVCLTVILFPTEATSKPIANRSFLGSSPL